MPIEVARADILSAEVGALIVELNAELSALYPEPGATHFRLDPTEVAPGRGAFLIARIDGRPVGCGAVRLLEGGEAEIKRMYVAPQVRGKGFGRAVLDHLEAEARKLGARRLVLETGTRQKAAILLYERAGFTQIPPYGEYVASADTSYCMAKDLA